MKADKTAIVHFGSQVGRTLAGFIGTLYIARTLGSEVFGTYVLAIAVVAWLQIPVNAVGAAVNKRVSEGESQSKFLIAGIALVGILVVALDSSIVLLSGVLNRFLGGQLSHLLVALYTSRAALTITNDGLRGQKKVEQAGILQMFEQILRTGFHVIFIISGYAIKGLFIGHTVSLLITAIVALSLYDVSVSVPGRSQFWRLITYARYSWLGEVQSRSLDWIDTLVLGIFVPTSFIGIYEIAWTLASTLGIVTISISNTLFPEVSEIDRKGNTERIRTVLHDAIAFVGILVIPGFFGVIVIGDRLLGIYGAEFTVGGIVLTLLVATRILTSYSTIFRSVISGMDRPDLSFRIAVVFLVFNILANFILIPTVGWTGAAIATMISAAISLVLSLRAVVLLVGWPDLPLFPLAIQVLTSVVMAGILVVLRSATPPNNYITIGLVVLGAGIYLSILVSVSKPIRTRLLTAFS